MSMCYDFMRKYAVVQVGELENVSGYLELVYSSFQFSLWVDVWLFSWVGKLIDPHLQRNRNWKSRIIN